MNQRSIRRPPHRKHDHELSNLWPSQQQRWYSHSPGSRVSAGNTGIPSNTGICPLNPGIHPGNTGHTGLCTDSSIGRATRSGLWCQSSNSSRCNPWNWLWPIRARPGTDAELWSDPGRFRSGPTDSSSTVVLQLYPGCRTIQPGGPVRAQFVPPAICATTSTWLTGTRQLGRPSPRSGDRLGALHPFRHHLQSQR